jgi:hypothetical protein
MASKAQVQQGGLPSQVPGHVSEPVGIRDLAGNILSVSPPPHSRSGGTSGTATIS